jgi:hypothetical protein
MPRFLSLDELMAREYESERNDGDDMTVGLCTQAYIAAVLEELPEESTSYGYYNGKPRDLVSIFRDN